MKDKARVKNLCKQAYELDKRYEKEYRGCGQCLVGAAQDALGIEGDEVFKAATGLAGGIGAQGDGSCGAYVGGVILLGQSIGREKSDFADPSGVRWRTYALVQKYHDRFMDYYGSVRCSDIQMKKFGRPYFLADKDEFTKFEEAGGHGDEGCPELVGKAAKWLVELLATENLISVASENHED